MRTLKILLLLAPLAAFAQAEKAPEPPKPGPGTMPAHMQCFMNTCQKADAKCRKECGKNGRCIAHCAMDMKVCAEGCGVPIGE